MPVARRIRRITAGLPSVAGGGASGITFDSGWSGSGTFADGQIVSITRGVGGLGARTDERPLRWIPGSSTSADGTYSRDTSSLTVQTGAGTQSSIKPYSSSPGTLDQQFNTPSSDTCFYSSRIADIGTTERAFISYYIYYGYSHTSDGSNNKIVRIWNVGQTSSALVANHFIQATDIDGDGGVVGSDFFDIADSSTTWYQVEHHFKESSATDAADGMWQYVVNGGLAQPDTSTLVTRNSGQASDSLKRHIYGPQMSNQPPPASGSHLYVADYYATDTLLHAFVSDESTYTTTVYSGGAPLSHERQIQIPQSTGNSDTTLSLLIRAGALSLSGKYLWVVASEGTRLRVGQFN